MRFIFVVEKPFSMRDVERFGVSELQANGFRVEVWDIGIMSLPRYPRSHKIKCEGLKFNNFLSFTELNKAAMELKSEDVALLLAGASVGQAWAYRWLRKIFLSADARLITITNGHTPFDKWPSLWLRLLETYTHTSNPMAFVKQLLKLIVLEIKNAAGAVLTMSRCRKLDYVFAGASIMGLDTGLVGKNTKFFHIHSLDMDVILKATKKISEAKGGCIAYLDSLGPLHPELTTYKIPFEMEAEKFFASNRRCLEYLHKLLGAPCFIAAHPRAELKQLDKFFHPIPIVFNQTPELVAQSVCVIGEPSMSLGMAAWFNKPAIILSHRNAPEWYQQLVNDFQSELGCVVWDVDEESTWVLPVVNSELYNRYCEKFLKKKDTTEKLFWNYVAEKLM